MGKNRGLFVGMFIMVILSIFAVIAHSPLVDSWLVDDKEFTKSNISEMIETQQDMTYYFDGVTDAMTYLLETEQVDTLTLDLNYFMDKFDSRSKKIDTNISHFFASPEYERNKTKMNIIIKN